jgi:hypothetical protein
MESLLRLATSGESSSRAARRGSMGQENSSFLVLLDANPLEDIANTQKRTGVMLKGKYYLQAEMNYWLDQIAPRFQHALDSEK